MIETTFTLEDWENAGIATYDNEALYKAEIEQLLNQIHEKCQKLGIAFIGRAYYAQSPNGVRGHSLITLPENLSMVPPQALIAMIVDSPNQESIDALESIAISSARKVTKFLGLGEQKH